MLQYKFTAEFVALKLENFKQLRETIFFKRSVLICVQIFRLS